MTINKVLDSMLILLGLLLSSAIMGQEIQVHVGHKVILSSRILQESRSMVIHLPDTYEDSKKSYPVLYR